MYHILNSSEIVLGSIHPDGVTILELVLMDRNVIWTNRLKSIPAEAVCKPAAALSLRLTCSQLVIALSRVLQRWDHRGTLLHFYALSLSQHHESLAIDCPATARAVSWETRATGHETETAGHDMTCRSWTRSALCFGASPSAVARSSFNLLLLPVLLCSSISRRAVFLHLSHTHNTDLPWDHGHTTHKLAGRLADG